MKEKNSRQIQAENTKKHLLSIASELLSHKTLDEISIQEICKAANVSVGAFYHHFENKAGIIIELYKGIDVFFINEIIPNIDETDPIDAILQYLSCQCEYAYNTGLDLVKNAYKAQIDNGNRFFLSNDRGLPNGLRTLISKASDKGIWKDNTDVESLTDELLIISRGIIYHWCISSGETNMMEKVRFMASNYLKSYTKK